MPPARNSWPSAPARIRQREDRRAVARQSAHVAHGTRRGGSERRGDHEHRARYVSRAMLSRYSHVRMEATRRAPDGIATRQREADEKRKEEAERKEQAEAVSESVVIQ